MASISAADIHLKVDGYSSNQQGDTRHTVYNVHVKCGALFWVVERRFNDFKDVHQKLRKEYGQNVPEIPGVGTFGNFFARIAADFIKKRAADLNTFVTQLSSIPSVFLSPNFQAFLEIPSHNVTIISASAAPSTPTPNDETDNRPREEAVDNPTIEDASDDDETEDESDDENSESKRLELGKVEKKSIRPTDFEFLKTIGKGSFGMVVRARHKASGQIYAIKVLNKEMIIKKNEERHIMAERNVLMKSGSHPFLVNMHYAFQTQKKLYLVLDMVNGGELFYHLQREKILSEPRARFYAAEMSVALGHLHDYKVIYRDLKPENILIDREGHVCLTDFGLCKEHLTYDDTTRTFCGTPEYLAPEVLMKKPYKMTVDWWCLGAVLYEMLSGLPPFYSKDQRLMYQQIVNSPLKFRQSLSTNAQSILRALLQKDPNMRLGAFRDFREIAQHPFFASINWDDLKHKRIRPPYVPPVTNAMSDRNIDPDFLSQPVPPSLKDGSPATSQMDKLGFKDFSYVQSNLAAIDEDH